MGFVSNLLKSAFTGHNYMKRDEYGSSWNQPYTPPTVKRLNDDDNGYPVYEVKADNYREASRPFNGTTYPGDVTRVYEHTGRGTWQVRIEPWDTKFKEPKDMTAKE